MLNSELPEAVCTVLRLETLTPSPARADRLRSRRLPSCGDESTERLAQYGRQGAVLRCRRLCGLPQARRGPCRRTPETGDRRDAARTLRAALRKGEDDAPGADQRSEERRVGKECGSTCRTRWS